MSPRGASDLCQLLQYNIKYNRQLSAKKIILLTQIQQKHFLQRQTELLCPYTDFCWYQLTKLLIKQQLINLFYTKHILLDCREPESYPRRLWVHVYPSAQPFTQLFTTITKHLHNYLHTTENV